MRFQKKREAMSTTGSKDAREGSVGGSGAVFTGGYKGATALAVGGDGDDYDDDDDDDDDEDEDDD